MNQIQIHKTGGRAVVLICLMLLVQTSLVRAAGGITGEWEITMEYSGQQSFATLSIAEKADGTLTGKWGSSELANVKFKDGKLTFTRTIRFGDNEFTMNYIGNLEDGKLFGLLSSDRGEFAANGARKKPKLPVLGHWNVKFNVGEREITGKLSISQKADGVLEGKWTSEGGNTVISNVKFQDGKLTYHRKSTLGDNTYESDFEGTVSGHKLTGAFKSQRGELPATGQRIGAALVGKWELTTTSERGTRQRTLTVYGDLTGRYESFGGGIPIKDLKLEGNQVTFATERRYRDQTYRSDFKATLDGDTIKGQITTSRGTTELTGKKVTTTSLVDRDIHVSGQGNARYGSESRRRSDQLQGHQDVQRESVHDELQRHAGRRYDQGQNHFIQGHNRADRQENRLRRRCQDGRISRPSARLKVWITLTADAADLDICRS
ncbi:MAG: hypothetical protein ACYSUD_10510 [Planctomycetota bacterium]|jgi:hypothetical protein